MKMNVKRALMAPVVLPYFLRAITVSTTPASKGDTMYMMLNPKITRLNATQRKAERKPAKNPRNMAANAHLFSVRRPFRDENKSYAPI